MLTGCLPENCSQSELDDFLQLEQSTPAPTLEYRDRVECTKEEGEVHPNEEEDPAINEAATILDFGGEEEDGVGGENGGEEEDGVGGEEEEGGEEVDEGKF